MKYGTGEINETTGFTQGPNPDIQYSSDYRSAQWRNSSWNYGNVPGINIDGPPQKDTVMVPYKGYVVIRLLADNPGSYIIKLLTYIQIKCITEYKTVYLHILCFYHLNPFVSWLCRILADALSSWNSHGHRYGSCFASWGDFRTAETSQRLSQMLKLQRNEIFR